jgi:hypothetical protein
MERGDWWRFDQPAYGNKALPLAGWPRFLLQPLGGDVAALVASAAAKRTKNGM